MIAGPRQQRRLIASWALIAIVLGALQAWTTRFQMNSDGISYMDMGDAFLRGDWRMAVNAYWSPLYSWLLGLAFHVFTPSARQEFPLVHLVNFIIYLFTLASFTFLLKQIVHYEQENAATLAGDGRRGLPPWAWLLLGYVAFLSTSLEWITLNAATPDMCVAASVYMASGLTLRIRRHARPRLSYVFLGLILGLGYLAKAPLFLLAFVFLGVTLVSARTREDKASALVACAAFLAVAVPWIVVLSRSKGRPTFSDTGGLTYAWYLSETNKAMDGATYRHWQGKPAGSGEPRHPTRLVLAEPAVYEFATPVGGTYPVWYDPSYWNEGLKVEFRVGRQLRVTMLRTLPDLCEWTLFAFHGGLASGLTILLIVSGRGRPICRDLAARWFLMIPAIAAYLMYAAVHVELRHVAPWFTVLALGSYGAVRVTDGVQSGRLIIGVMVVIVALWCRSMFPWAARAARTTFREVVTGRDAEPCLACQIAEGLAKRGVHLGDAVASLKYSNGPNVFWARLAKARIVGEIYLPGRDYEFWKETSDNRRRVVAALRRTTARVIVDDSLPAWAVSEGWQKVENTSYGVLFLEEVPANVFPLPR